jgi:hypothetical protein
LTALVKTLSSADAAGATSVHSTLQRWQREAALDGIRNPERLMELDGLERGRWESFWAEVEGVRQLARIKIP